MGHRHDDAIAALRAYARDLEAAAGGHAARTVGGPDQDDAAAATPGSGAPHQLAIAAVAAGVVLIGSIGVASALGRSSSEQPPAAVEAQPTATTTAAVGVPTSESAATAARAFHALGMSRAARAVDEALTAGLDDDETFNDALEGLRSVVAMYAASGRSFDESAEPLASAVAALESAVRPPGLDPEFVPPGKGGTPPGQDPEFVPPGQDPEFVPPGRDPEFIPPGQDDSRVAPGNRGTPSEGKAKDKDKGADG